MESILFDSYRKYQKEQKDYCLAVEVLTCVALYFYIENFQIKTSDSLLFVYQEYCEKNQTLA